MRSKGSLPLLQTKEEIAVRIEKLHVALVRFKSSRIVDVSQLGLGSYYFGSRVGDSDWQEALWLDLNCDGRVGIEDLSFIANKMLVE